jgi:hypothetical protein
MGRPALQRFPVRFRNGSGTGKQRIRQKPLDPASRNEQQQGCWNGIASTANPLKDSAGGGGATAEARGRVGRRFPGNRRRCAGFDVERLWPLTSVPDQRALWDAEVAHVVMRTLQGIGPPPRRSLRMSISRRSPADAVVDDSPVGLVRVVSEVL